MKLKESIPSNGVKIIDLYNKINSEILITRPDFQRKLVWKKQHKYHFIETILWNFPFPEIYIASSEMDVETLTAKEIVVDGQQRLSTIVDYIKGVNDFKEQTKIPPFDSLHVDDKKVFLNYQVSVKDLKDMDVDVIKEIFKRINNTEYSLNAVEKTNAQYGDGEFAIFCKQLVDDTYKVTNDDTDIVLDDKVREMFNVFFTSYEVFNENDRSRMFDLQYAMQLVSTILEPDYYHRNNKVEEYLRTYNSKFDRYQEALDKMVKSISVVSELGLASKSYWFNKANLFTLIVELAKDQSKKLDLVKLETNLRELENKNDLYYSEEDSNLITEEEKKYFEAARQGVNDKGSRLQRAKVVSEIIRISETEPMAIGVSDFVDHNVKVLNQKGYNVVMFSVTKTALEKYNIDAVSSVREFLHVMKVHDFYAQKNGTENKVVKDVKFVLQERTIGVQVSFYKASARGDARIWITELNSLANEQDVIALFVKNNELFISNLSRSNLSDVAL
jgi:hypothetical protein